MDKRIAVVTGATKGIGLSIAKELVEKGYKVYGTYVSDYKKETLALIEEENLILLRCDASSAESSQAVIDSVVEKEGCVDVLVNNAGITKDGLLLRMDSEAFDTVLQTNLVGAFNMTKAVTRHMMKKRQGRIINISSVVGITGNAGQANYAASKAGLIGFSKSVAKELASRNITVNCVAPGFIKTDMTDVLKDEIKDALLTQIPLKRFGEPSDVAKAVTFLASEDASYITGQVIGVCGGMVM